MKEGGEGVKVVMVRQVPLMEMESPRWASDRRKGGVEMVRVVPLVEVDLVREVMAGLRVSLDGGWIFWGEGGGGRTADALDDAGEHVVEDSLDSFFKADMDFGDDVLRRKR